MLAIGTLVIIKRCSGLSYTFDEPVKGRIVRTYRDGYTIKYKPPNAIYRHITLLRDHFHVVKQTDRQVTQI